MSYSAHFSVLIDDATPTVLNRTPDRKTPALKIRRPAVWFGFFPHLEQAAGLPLATATLGGVCMATAVGKLTIWSIVALVAIVAIALILVNR